MTTRQNGGSSAPQPDGLLQPELFGAKPHRPQRHNKQPERGTYLHDFSWASSDWGSLGQRGSDRKPESSSSVSERPSNPPVTEADPYGGALDWSWPSPGAAKEERDFNLAKVTTNAGSDFRQKAIACILRVWAGREATSEDFRLTCEQQGIVPHHHNAWGGLTMGLKKMGALIETGELRAMKSSKSHARRTMVYRVVNPALDNWTAIS